MTNYLEITLKSDICIGSGYSYASVIDTDSCFDRFGLPFIPARRIKGCLREAAELIGEDTSIFGDWGQNRTSQDTPVYLSDARICGYDEITESLEKAASFAAVKSYFSPDQIRQCYSRVKAQTRIDKNGVAEENTLRFTRIVNQYGPDGKELKFLAEIHLNDGDSRSLEALRNAARALRHMGEDRNRGLGIVRCRLLPEETEMESGMSDPAGISIKRLVITNQELLNTAGEAWVELRYVVKTEAPVVISMEDDKNSETYINGRSVLGCFADAYLKRKAKHTGGQTEQSDNPADEAFEQLFLKGGLRFSPLYPTSIREKRIFVYTPAPSWIAKLKKSGEIVNISRSRFPGEEDLNYGKDVENGRYFPGNGNQPKKLKGKYVSFADGNPEIREVETELIYHHRHESAASKEQLYALNAISAGQYFSGTITGKAEDVKLMAEILKKTPLRFGKSRSAQYGKCRAVCAEVCQIKGNQTAALSVNKGDRLLVTLQSDGLFLEEETGNYTARTETVRGQIRESLEEFLKNSGQSATGSFLEVQNTENVADTGKTDCLYSEIEVKQLSGYYGVWNLRRASVPCVCAGTTFEYSAVCDFVVPEGEILTGVCNSDGFGILTVRKSTEDWLVGKKADCDAGETLAEVTDTNYPGKPSGSAENDEEKLSDVLRAIYLKSVKGELFRKMEDKALNVKKGSLSASAVGRITLMLTECVNESGQAPNGQAPDKTEQAGTNPEGKDQKEEDPRDIRKNLEIRIQSIKDRDKQKKAMAFIKEYYDKAIEEEDAFYREILERIPNEKEKLVAECRLYCLTQALVMLKYKTKEEN